jgi:hypothetical protein
VALSDRESSLSSTIQFFIGTFLMQYGLYSYLFHLILPRWRGQSPETWDSLILCLAVGLMLTKEHFLTSKRV